MNFATIIKEIGRGAKGAKSIDATSAETLFGAMLDGTVPDLELGAIVMALRFKSEWCNALRLLHPTAERHHDATPG